MAVNFPLHVIIPVFIVAVLFNAYFYISISMTSYDYNKKKKSINHYGRIMFFCPLRYGGYLSILFYC